MLICMAWHRHWHLEMEANHSFWRPFRSFRSNRGNGMGKKQQVSCFAALRSLHGKRRQDDDRAHHGKERTPQDGDAHRTTWGEEGPTILDCPDMREG